MQLCDKAKERRWIPNTEVRGLFHPMYRREMVNRNASQNMAGYARGRDALIPYTC